MEAPKFNNFEKYKTSEVLNEFGIHRNTLNNYVKAGYIAPCPTKIKCRENKYLGRDLNKLAKQLGY